MFSKPSSSDTAMNSDSYCPMEHTLAAYELLLSGMYQLPLSPQKQQPEISTIMHIAKKQWLPKEPNVTTKQDNEKLQNSHCKS
jgi:hypothetical protein